MKFNSPLPAPLPKGALYASRLIFASFVDNANHGLDGIIPRSVLEGAKGFAIFTVFKAGFVLSARGGSGVVIARLDDGSWSAPSAIGTAGMGFGGQLGAEVTDFLLILNTRTKQFMSAGSLTLGGNMSIALGPMGRNGEATGALNTSGKVAAMYAYSKTKGLFGGVSLEGSVIVERQDANALAYDADVTARMLLSGAIPAPAWASVLITTLERCTGMPGGRKWLMEDPTLTPELGIGYAFGGEGSPGSRKNKGSGAWSPFGGNHKKRDSYFASDFIADSPPRSPVQSAGETSATFETSFESAPGPRSKRTPSIFSTKASNNLIDFDDFNSPSEPSPLRRSSSNPFAKKEPPSASTSAADAELSTSPSSRPFLTARAGLKEPLAPSEVGRAIALHDFDAVEPGDLSFMKGDIVHITYRTNSTNDWWKGRVGKREGNFPAN
ncbi:DUF500-domain-containing protein [Auricularia subglabra TFB-10046 SS5]|nr:DUF500-domain-containing protein [Auricularia subglabra TFB-10046 SS5]